MKILLIFLYSPKKLIQVLFFFGEFYEKILIWEKHDKCSLRHCANDQARLGHWITCDTVR